MRLANGLHFPGLVDVFQQGSILEIQKESIGELKKAIELVRWPGTLLSLLSILDELCFQLFLCRLVHVQLIIVAHYFMALL